jgi:tetraacyldisaccharide 4'-kinase
MAGRVVSPVAKLLRAVLWCFEQPYVLVLRVRNRLYEQGVMRSRTLQRPVVSVGNITTGGTGKSPVVTWIARELLARGKRPAILLRGYRSKHGQSDEASEYQHKLADTGILIRAHRDRVASAEELLKTRSDIDLFILDDGMQHRRVTRQCEIVLVDATDPFGHEHVLPRGLLREPMEGLRRADVIVLTRVDRATPTMIGGILQQVQRHTSAPVLRCRHVLSGMVDQQGLLVDTAGKRFYAFAGLGNPQPFFAQLRALPGECVGTHAFDDHVRFASKDDFERRVVAHARKANADFIVTTRKNAQVLPDGEWGMPIVVAELELEFYDDHAQRLLEIIQSKIETGR